MTVEELARVVADYRHAVKKYVRSRSQSALEECTRLERKLDRCVATELDGQKRMFEE